LSIPEWLFCIPECVLLDLRAFVVEVAVAVPFSTVPTTGIFWDDAAPLFITLATVPVAKVSVGFLTTAETATAVPMTTVDRTLTAEDETGVTVGVTPAVAATTCGVADVLGPTPPALFAVVSVEVLPALLKL